MNRKFSRRRRRIQRKIKAIKISKKILSIILIIVGFGAALGLGILGGQLFGTKVVVDQDAMAPSIESGAAVKVNKLSYKLKKPGRMDVIVFDMGKNETSRYYIRRVIGLPGETVEIKDGVIYINDEPLEYKYNTEYIENPGLAGEPVKLGSDEYFVMGDNYNACEDSRSPAMGNIHKDQIVGKAG